jgi:hypothetical protein
VIYRQTKIVFFVYGAWALLLFAISVFNPGEPRVSTHIFLLITGLPSALFTLSLQNASLHAIAIAGIAGTVQWSAFAQFDAWMDERQRRRGGI